MKIRADRLFRRYGYFRLVFYQQPFAAFPCRPPFANTGRTVIAKEGYPIIAVTLLVALAVAGISMVVDGFWRVLLVGASVVLVGFVLYFFRDPRRVPPEEAGLGRLVLAPADGKIVVVGEVHEPLYLKTAARQVSIFLSPLNVHVNRVPARGVIEYERYVPGEYLVAWHPKASEKNERSEIGLRHPLGYRILFKQIAGAVARRIVYYLKTGQEVEAGDRFGIVKFGSRMDIIMPLEFSVEVAVGDRVSAGLSILARIPEPSPEPT